MRAPDQKFDRLLRAAAGTGRDLPAEMPFGFDTRVIVSSRGSQFSERGFFASLVPRMLALAVGLTLVASAGAYWQVAKNDALTEPFRNGYAIADNAIESGVLR